MACTNCQKRMRPSHEIAVTPEVFPELFEESALPELELPEVLTSEVPGRRPSGPAQRGAAQLRCRPPVVLDGFKTGEYTLRRVHYRALLALPLPLPARVVVIRGHTDNQGDALSNRGLSLSRAFEVLQWLTLGNGGNPIAPRIIVEGFGPVQPVASNATENGRSRNRRVEIFLCQAPPPPPVFANVIRIQSGRR